MTYLRVSVCGGLSLETFAKYLPQSQYRHESNTILYECPFGKIELYCYRYSFSRRDYEPLSIEYNVDFGCPSADECVIHACLESNYYRPTTFNKKGFLINWDSEYATKNDPGMEQAKCIEVTAINEDSLLDGLAKCFIRLVSTRYFNTECIGFGQRVWLPFYPSNEDFIYREDPEE